MTKITKREAEQKMRGKIQAINTLCRQLEIVIEAAQKLDENGFIKTVVTYTDVEKYEFIPEELPKDDSVEEKPVEDIAAPVNEQENETKN
jgi:hypothetical protein